MAKQNFLFELGCEELPPKSLKKFRDSLVNSVADWLEKNELDFEEVIGYAAPRRLAIYITDLADQQPEQTIKRKGPALTAAYDAEGNPTKAALGFAKSCGIDISDAEVLETDKGSWLHYQAKQAGKTVQDLMPECMQHALKQLPIPKPMRWGDSDVEFIRPVHWLVMLYGDQLIEGQLLGLNSGQQTRGHRYHANNAIDIPHADKYLETLQQQGYVIACFDQRRDMIEQQIKAIAKQRSATAVLDPDLLDEVCAINEWPKALCIDFDARFLQVPKEALISSMQDHQKCFAMTNEQGDLVPHFITIANIESHNEQRVIEGNQRVMAARLSDAEFFFLTDQKSKLQDHVEQLKSVTFERQLGSMHDKVTRTVELAKHIASQLNVNEADAAQAAELLKADLMTNMVEEFPELQGIMGYYYAKLEGYSDEVATAIEAHYHPRFADDSLPQSALGNVVAIADRIDTLVGIFGINKLPTGDKDPFALRRQALGVLRILLDNQLDLDLSQLFGLAANAYGDKLKNDELIAQLLSFFHERFKAWYLEQGGKVDVFHAVIARQTHQPYDAFLRLQAVTDFSRLPQAATLAQANKRVSKILAKEQLTQETVDETMLQEPAAVELNRQLNAVEEAIQPMLLQANYGEVLEKLSGLSDTIDEFFDNVLVMADDPGVKANRLALLQQLRRCFLQVADISLLQS